MKAMAWVAFAAWAVGVFWLYGKDHNAAYFFGSFTLTLIILKARAGARRGRQRNPR